MGDRVLSTKYTDDETWLVYYGQRYYAPSFGRWLSRDPIQERGGINLFASFANQPTMRIDFLGWTSVPTLISYAECWNEAKAIEAIPDSSEDCHCNLDGARVDREDRQEFPGGLAGVTAQRIRQVDADRCEFRVFRYYRGNEQVREINRCFALLTCTWDDGSGNITIELVEEEILRREQTRGEGNSSVGPVIEIHSCDWDFSDERFAEMP